MVDAGPDTADRIAELVGLDAYQQALRWQADRGCKIIPADRGLDAALAAKPIVASGCTIEELRESLAAEPEIFNWFVAEKLKVFADDDEEEYPPGQAPPPDERPKTLETLGYTEFFLVSHLCEFTLLRSRPDTVEAYAKRYRIPRAKKYARQLKRIFKTAKGRGAQ